MALANGTIFQIQATATTGNVNGAGFNIANANFPTDLAATSGTTTAPSVTSATYTFLSTDIGSWIYVKAGTNWIVGWYNITNVIGGAAILNGTIGAAILSIGSTGIVTYSTAQGCVTGSYVSGTASGTYGVDYSQVDTAPIISGTTTGTQTNTSTTFTDTTASLFTKAMVGNLIHLTAVTGAGALVGWYEIVSVTDTQNIVLDRTATAGANITAATYYVGGAGRMNGLEGTFQASLPASAIVFVKNGSYTLSGAISGANTNPTAILPAFWIGYNSTRGDTCNGSNRPTFVAGANTMTFGQDQCFQNISFSSSVNGTSLTTGTTAKIINCKIFNTSVGASATGLTVGANTSVAGTEVFTAGSNSAIISSTTSIVVLLGNYIHDSTKGVSGANGALWAVGNIFEGCSTSAIANSSAGSLIVNNTIYGREAQTGTGISLTTANSTHNQVVNNIIYGCTTGISVTTGSAGTNLSLNNDFFNNGTDVTFWTKELSDLALNPTFTSVLQVTGTAGQGLAGNKFQDTTQNFTTAGVIANQDILHITSGGSLTAGAYLITAITTTTNPNDTLTLSVSPGTGAATGVYWITVGHNFQIGTNLKAQGFPAFTNATGSLTTSYMDIGAVQRQEPASSGGTVGYAFC